MSVSLQEVNLIDFIQEVNNENFDNTKEMREDSSLNELHMHKLLYFLYGKFWREFQKELFKPKFLAWKYGPVEINYRNYLKAPVGSKEAEGFYKKFWVRVNKQEMKFLHEEINWLAELPDYYLVDVSHTTRPWINHHEPNKSNEIPNQEIKDEFECFNFLVRT